MVKCSPMLGALVSTKTKCIKLIFIGKTTLVPVAFLMALSIYSKYNILFINLFLELYFLSSNLQCLIDVFEKFSGCKIKFF